MVFVTYEKDKYCKLVYSFRENGESKKKNFYLARKKFPELYYLNIKIVRSKLLREVYFSYPQLRDLKIDWNSIIKKVRNKKEEKRKEFEKVFKEFAKDDNKKLERYIPNHYLLIINSGVIESIINKCLMHPLLKKKKSELDEITEKQINIKDNLQRLISNIELNKDYKRIYLDEYRKLPKSTEIDLLFKKLNSKIVELNTNSSIP